MNQVEAFRRWHSTFTQLLTTMAAKAGFNHIADMASAPQARAIVLAASSAAARCAGTVATETDEECGRIHDGVLEAMLAQSSINHVRAGTPEAGRIFTAGANAVTAKLTTRRAPDRGV
jgi:hypothetical protein